MKISVNDVELYTLSDTQKKVLEDEIATEMLDQDLKRRLQWVLTHKYEQTFEALKFEWIPKLEANGIESIPLDDDAFASLVFAQPNYKNRSTRDAEAQQ